MLILLLLLLVLILAGAASPSTCCGSRPLSSPSSGLSASRWAGARVREVATSTTGNCHHVGCGYDRARSDAPSPVDVAQPEAVTAAIESVGVRLGVSDVVVYLVDFGQTVLEPLGNQAHRSCPTVRMLSRPWRGAPSHPGPVMAERPEGTRLWVPILEGSDRSGVLAAHPAR